MRLSRALQLFIRGFACDRTEFALENIALCQQFAALLRRVKGAMNC